METFTVSEIARKLGIPPRVISTLFYMRILDDVRCPIVRGRRRIDAAYLPTVERVLRERGYLEPAHV